MRVTTHSTRLRSAAAAVAPPLFLLVACTQPTPPATAAPAADPHASKVDGSDARCFTIERAAPPEGGLSIPRQFVCPVVTPGNAVQD